jgi:hypothetical protein
VQNQDRFKTILVIVIGLLVLPYIFKSLSGTAFTAAAIIIGVLSLMSAFIAKWIEWAWLKLALGLGWVNSRILLSAIYFLFLMPIAVVSRLFTKDPLQLKGKTAKSVFVNRDHLYRKEDLENIW